MLQYLSSLAHPVHARSFFIEPPMDKKMANDKSLDDITDGVHVLGGTEGMKFEENGQISNMRTHYICK